MFALRRSRDLARLYDHLQAGDNLSRLAGGRPCPAARHIMAQARAALSSTGRRQIAAARMMVAALLCAAAQPGWSQTELNVQLTRATPEFSGFIRVQGGRFVDAACSVFPVIGLNACAPAARRSRGFLQIFATLPGCWGCL